MQMRVDVVPDSQATTTQADSDSAVNDATNHDIGSSNTLLFQMQHPVYHLVNGNRVWQVHAGLDTGHYSLMAMLPSVLHIRKGDKVEWHFAGLFKEDHSVVFNSKTANHIANGTGSPVCEGDGTTDNPPDTQSPPFCNDPSKLELAIDPGLLAPSGDGKLTSASDIENSGLRGAGLSDAPFTLRFPNASGRKTPFKSACGLHGGLMLGKVFVR
jgi:hypothetical protein